MFIFVSGNSLIYLLLLSVVNIIFWIQSLKCSSYTTLINLFQVIISPTATKAPIVVHQNEYTSSISETTNNNIPLGVDDPLKEANTEKRDATVSTNKSNSSQQFKSKRRHSKRNSANKNTKSNRNNNNKKPQLALKNIITPANLHADTNNEKEQQTEVDHALDDMDAPGLSDSESTTTESTIYSPQLSTMSLPKDENQDNYYSLFSTGFDFGVSPIMPSIQEHKFYQPIKYNTGLSFQNSTPSVANIQPSSSNKKTVYRRSLLDMLDQDQHAQTTITPTAFSYFDDMMMSTSLFKEHNHYHQQFKHFDSNSSFAR